MGLSLLPQLFIYSFISLHQCGLMDIYPPLWVIARHDCLLAQIVPGLAIGRSGSWLLCPPSS